MLKHKTFDVPLITKSIGDDGSFAGYGSVFNVRDGAGDIVIPGAFTKSLANKKPAMLWQHKTDEPIGVYDVVEEDEKGLYLEGRLLIEHDDLAKRAHAHLKAQSLTGLSIGFCLNDYEYDKEKDAFLLKDIDLWEVSLVTFPCNQEARISDVKSAIAKGEQVDIRDLELILRDAGLSRKLAKALIASGYAGIADQRDAEPSLNSLQGRLSKYKW